MANTKISALPAGAPAVGTDLLPIDRAGTNVSLQVSDVLAAITSANIPNNAANTSGTAANLSGTPALPNGTTAITQAAFDNSGNLSTDAYADNNFKGVSVAGFREDFFNIPNNVTIGAGSVVTFAADTGWELAGIGGTATVEPANGGTFTNPGGAQISTAAVSGEGGVIYKANDGNAPLGVLGANSGWEINSVFKIPVDTTICIRLGTCATAKQITDPPQNGFWVEFDTANANSNTDFTWRTDLAGTSSYSVTNSKPVDVNYHHVRIRSTVSGTIGFTIDGGTEFTTTTDISASAQLPFAQVLARTSSAMILTVDFFSYMAATGRT